MITFNDVLRLAGVDPGHVRLARHQDSRIRGRSIYTVWKSRGGPELLEEYQAVQAREVFEIGGFVASFVVTPAPRNDTLFIGLYAVRGVGKCEVGQRDPISGADVSGYYRYELARDSRLDEYKGRLAVDWGLGTRKWVQLAFRQPKPVIAICDQDDPPFPGFSQICVQVERVPDLPLTWQDRLREVKGIYVLVDRATGQQYVGSAKGEDSLWGRFSDYARTGDGGNVELKNRKGAQYQIGVLQVVDTSFPDHRIEEIEGWWKRKLMSREHGLNRN